MTRLSWVYALALVLVPKNLAGVGAVPAAQAPAGVSGIVGNAENGQRLFVKDTCYFCHGYAGQGSRDGARIAATAMNAQAFIRYLRRPFGAMPAFTAKVVADQDAMDILAYLKSLPVALPAKDIPLLNQLRDK